MSFRIGPVGPRGLAVLGATAVLGVLLANHGWATYHGTTTPGSLAGGATAHVTGTPATRPAASGNSHATPPTSGPTGSSSSPGPLLSSEPYAQYAFQVWPGTPSAAAKAALTGLSVTVHSQAGGLSVTAGVNGQPAGAPHRYPGGVRVYIVEAAMGDDSGTSDYNLGDDGLVVTDAQGRILQ
jgi:hypothetical protein